VSRGVSFTLSVPGVQCFCTPGDVAVLRTALDAAESFSELDDTARSAAIEEAASRASIFPMPVA